MTGGAFVMADLDKTHSDNRKATWLELFFDLIFVAAIAKAVHVAQHSTIILLGKSVLGLSASFGMLEWTMPSLIMAGCGFTVACGWWWIYFNSIERGVLGRSLSMSGV